MLDQLFCCIITPLFFVETMAGLSKEPRRPQMPERVVSQLAERTPVVHSYVNTYHRQLILDEMLGSAFAMDRRPVVPGGIPVQAGDGTDGVVFQKSPEAQAFERWQRGRFSDVERITARLWRTQLASIDLHAIAKSYRDLMNKDALPRSHESAHALAREIVDAPGRNYQALVIAHNQLELPTAVLPAVISSWRKSGSKPLRAYAPYASHCLEVDLYFAFAMSNGLISSERPSNRVDMDYLYYLPFCNIFVSGDKLHRRSVPLFLGQDQLFVWAADLKADLARLLNHFDQLPAAEKARGLFSLVTQPPAGDEGVCATLWDRVRPGWRTPRAPIRPLTAEQHADLIGRSNSMRELAAQRATARHIAPGPTDPTHLIIERDIPRQRGSWRMFSAEFEEAEDRRIAEKKRGQTT